MMMTQTRTTLAFGGFAAAMMVAGAALADGSFPATMEAWGADCADQICPAPVAKDQLAPADWTYEDRVANRDTLMDGEPYGVVMAPRAEFNERLKAFWTVGVFR